MHADTANSTAPADVLDCRAHVIVADAEPVPATLADGPKRLAARTGQVNQTEPLLIADTEAARLAGVGRSTWHRLRAAGKVPPAVKLGRACRWRRAEIVAWVEAGCPDARTWAAMRVAGRRTT